MSSIPLQIHEQLAEVGYRNQFQFRNGMMRCVNSGRSYCSFELRVQANYRFEENSDPNDSAVLWVLKATDGTGGVYFDAHGLYGDPEAAAFIRRISDRRKRYSLMANLPAAKTIELVRDQGPRIRQLAA